MIKKSNNLYRDVASGVLFISGVFGFISGEFIISTVLFALSAISSNLDFESRFKA